MFLSRGENSCLALDSFLSHAQLISFNHSASWLMIFFLTYRPSLNYLSFFSPFPLVLLVNSAV